MKTGRPEFKHQAYYQAISTLYPDITTKKGLQNKVYEILALRLIREEYKIEVEEQYKRPWGKPVVLTELGRLLDINSDLKPVLDWFEEDGWTIKGMVVTIRDMRSEFRK